MVEDEFEWDSTTRDRPQPSPAQPTKPQSDRIDHAITNKKRSVHQIDVTSVTYVRVVCVLYGWVVLVLIPLVLSCLVG